MIYMVRLKNRREISSCQIKNIPKKKFGEKVGEIAEKDPVKARKLLLAGYRLQEKMDQQ